MKESQRKTATVRVRRRWRRPREFRVDLEKCDIGAWSVRHPRARLSPTQQAPDVDEVISSLGNRSLEDRMVAASRRRGYELTIIKGKTRTPACPTDYVNPGETVEIRFK